MGLGRASRNPGPDKAMWPSFPGSQSHPQRLSQERVYHPIPANERQANGDVLWAVRAMGAWYSQGPWCGAWEWSQQGQSGAPVRRENGPLTPPGLHLSYLPLPPLAFAGMRNIPFPFLNKLMWVEFRHLQCEQLWWMHELNWINACKATLDGFGKFVSTRLPLVTF